MFNHYFSLVIYVVDGLELLLIDIIAIERNRQFRTMFMDGKRPERPFIIWFPISTNTLYTRSHIYCFLGGSKNPIRKLHILRSYIIMKH